VACAANPGAPSAKPAGAATAAPASAANTSAAAPAAAGGTATAAPAPRAPEPPGTVSVGYLNSASDAGILLAVEKGYFAEQGLDVQLERFQTGAVMTAPLGAGQLDVGAGSPSAGLYNAVARNITIKIVADKGSDLPGFGFQGLALRQGLQDRVRTYADLSGLKVAMTGTGGTSAEIVLAEALRQGGLTMDDVDIATIAYGDLNTALSTGAVDAAIHFEPLFTVGVRQGVAVDWKRADEIYPNHQAAAILYGMPFIQDKPDLARRWMVAYARGVRYYNDAFRKDQNKDDVIAILAQATGAPVAVLAQAVPTGLNPDVYVNAAGIAADIQILLNLGFVNQPLDVNAVVDNSYADYALQQLGRYR
jgi:ABC-type nitrate/sulfonate/bicarbonate transport system substrate-binding protein